MAPHAVETGSLGGTAHKPLRSPVARSDIAHPLALWNRQGDTDGVILRSGLPLSVADRVLGLAEVSGSGLTLEPADRL
jgi:hypothetical protein